MLDTEIIWTALSGSKVTITEPHDKERGRWFYDVSWEGRSFEIIESPTHGWGLNVITDTEPDFDTKPEEVFDSLELCLERIKTIVEE